MGIEHIRSAFQTGRAAFMPYAVMGYPTIEGSLNVLRTLVASGADLLEIGVPFSDPLADGPVIQAAGQKALQNGITLAKCIQMVAQLRGEGIQTPALLMSYINPLLAYGVERCVADCYAAGVDGFIIPDLPPEEAGEMEAACQRFDMALVYLLAPTSPANRIASAAKASKGFIYLVSLTGVTGARQSLPPGLSEFVRRVRDVSSQPLAVGFGIGTGAQAQEVARLADGVIVGSALVRCAGESLESLRNLAQEIRQALDQPGQH